MKILFVSHVSEKYGAGRSLLDLIDGLLQKGVKCYVIMPRQGLMAKELENRDIKYSIIPFKNWTSVGRITLRQMARNGWNLFMSLIIAIKAHFWKVDVIHTNSSVTPVGALAAYLARKPHVWHIREFVEEHYGLSFRFGKLFTMKLIKRLSFCVVVISEALRQKYSDYIPTQKLKMVYDPVSMVNKISNNFKTKYNPEILTIPTLLMIGYVYPGKGQMDAVLAVANLVKQNIRVKLKIVGDVVPKYFEQLKQVIIRNQIDKQVEFIKYTDNIASLYNSVDIILVCSRWEAFGRVTVESMLFKKPVIGARSGATPELIKEGFNGLLYEPGNYQELAKKIKYLIKHPKEAKKIGENGFKEANKKYTIEKSANQVYKIFQEAIKSKK